MKTLQALAAVICAGAAILTPARAQTTDPSLGRRLAETTCRTCHQIAPDTPALNPKSGAPSFVAVSRMPSTNEIAIKVFLRTSHPTMPNLILTPEELDSVAAYILGLAKQ